MTLSILIPHSEKKNGICYAFYQNKMREDNDLSEMDQKSKSTLNLDCCI